jgi:hypothetical protein
MDQRGIPPRNVTVRQIASVLAAQRARLATLLPISQN